MTGKGKIRMRILVVEDNQTLSEGLAKVLESNGYSVDVVRNGADADAVLAAQDYDLVVLDLTLPDMDGLEVLRNMRSRRNAQPVLILTARDALDERIKGLDLGADDYLTKPFEVQELEARIRVLLRRHAGLRSSKIGFGSIELDMNTRAIYHDGSILDVPARELNLLQTLMMSNGRVVSKIQLVESFSSFEDEISENAVEQYVSRLRKRLLPCGVGIAVARGLGYYLKENDGV